MQTTGNDQSTTGGGEIQEGGGSSNLENPISVIHNNSSSPSPSENGKKAVTFFLETPTNGSSSRKQQLSKDQIESLPRQEIDQLVVNLQQKVERLTVDYSGEKALRKKKDRNMIKLAKQLNLNAKEINDKNEKIKQLLNDQAAMERRLQDHKISLDATQLELTNATREYNIEINKLHSKNRMIQDECQETMAKLSLENGEHVENLRRQVLQSQLETDKLRAQLAGLQIQLEGGSDDGADEIVQKTLQEHDDTKNNNNNEYDTIDKVKKKGKGHADNSLLFWRVLGIFVGALLIPCVAIAHELDWLSKSAMCAPAMPGTFLDAGNVVLEAPWWVPSSMKQTTFDWLCQDRRRTRIQWIPLNNNKSFKIIVTDLNKKGTNNGHVFERKAATVTFHSNSISYQNNRGSKTEKRKAPWVSSS